MLREAAEKLATFSGGATSMVLGRVPVKTDDQVTDEDLPLVEARYKAFVAKRRIVSFGAGYDFDINALVRAPPLPPFLVAVRERVSAWTGIPAGELRQCTVAEYRPGTQLGWHRDVLRFGAVVGISLAAPCRMRLRPYPPPKHARSRVLVLEPRSAYALRDEARWRWQHAISPTKALRYSITFRTIRSRSER